MEKLIANVRGKPRRETLYGREYLVASMTLIVPGVLNGSNGPLYYPPEEVSRYPEIWNHKPITLNHPAAGGSNNPAILNQSKLGFLLNTRFKDGSLIADGWFEIHRVLQVDKRILENLIKGIPIELSTGLAVDTETTNETEINGKRYSEIARNYRPDHLAILPDAVGACSIRDGCGVLVGNEYREIRTELNLKSLPEGASWKRVLGEEDNTLYEVTILIPNRGTPKMASEKLVAELIENCDCWGEKDKETLLNMPDEKINLFLETAKKNKQTQAVANAATEGFEDQQGDFHTFNKQEGKWETVNKEPESKEKEEPEVNNEPKPLTPEQWFETAPPIVQEQAREYSRITNAEKERLTVRLITNAKDDEDKEEIKNWTRDQSLESLRIAVKALPQEKKGNPYSADYSGANPAISNEQPIPKPTPLGQPAWDFEVTI